MSACLIHALRHVSDCTALAELSLCIYRHSHEAESASQGSEPSFVERWSFPTLATERLFAEMDGQLSAGRDAGSAAGGPTKVPHRGARGIGSATAEGV